MLAKTDVAILYSSSEAGSAVVIFCSLTLTPLFTAAGELSHIPEHVVHLAYKNRLSPWSEKLMTRVHISI